MLGFLFIESWIRKYFSCSRRQMLQGKETFFQNSPQLLSNGGWDENILKSCASHSHEWHGREIFEWHLEGNSANPSLSPYSNLQTPQFQTHENEHEPPFHWKTSRLCISIINSGTLVMQGEGIAAPQVQTVDMVAHLPPPSRLSSGLCFPDTSCHAGSCSFSFPCLLCRLELQDHGLQSFLHHLELPLERLWARC